MNDENIRWDLETFGERLITDRVSQFLLKKTPSGGGIGGTAFQVTEILEQNNTDVAVSFSHLFICCTLSKEFLRFQPTYLCLGTPSGIETEGMYASLTV